MAHKALPGQTNKFFITLIGLTVLGLLLRELAHIFLPFTIAYFLFFVFAPLNGYLRNKRIPLLAVIVFDILIILFISFGLSQFVIESFSQFSSQWQEYSQKLNELVRGASASLGIKDPYFRYFNIERIIAKIDYRELAGGIFSSAFSVMGSVFLVVIFFSFIVGGHQDLFDAIRRRYVSGSLRRRQRDEALYHTQELILEDEAGVDRFAQQKAAGEQLVESTVKAITEQIQKYIITKIAINLAAGITIGVVLYFMGIDFFLLWGGCVFLLNFIPTIGAAFALLLPVLWSLLQVGSWGYALLIAGVVALVQTLYFNVIEPLVIGKRLDLNPIVILLAVLIWGSIWGVAGMLLAVPLTAIIKIIISTSDGENLRFVADLMNHE